MPAYDHDVFFQSIRTTFGNLKQAQVDGFNAILIEAETRGTDPAQFAYILATTWHETARTMQPIEEYGKGAGRTYGPTGFWGRGYVQLTWEDNYRRATAELHKLDVLSPAEDLVETPDLAMRLDVALAVLFAGMEQGWFTGRKLSDYINGAAADYVNARRIINGTDKASEIAGYARAFAAGLVPSTAPALPPLKPAPFPIPSTPAPAGSSPAPASVPTATKEAPMSPAPAINFGAGLANIFENFAQSIFTGAAAVASPSVDTKTSAGNPITNFGADIASAKRVGSEILEIVGDFRRKDLAGGADDAIDLAREVFSALDRHGLKVPIVTDAIKSIDLDPNG